MPGRPLSDRDDLHARAERYRTLADVTRLKVIELLATTGERCASEIAESLGLAPSTLSFHLTSLARGGLVTRRRDGRRNLYAIDAEALRSVGLEPGEEPA